MAGERVESSPVYSGEDIDDTSLSSPQSYIEFLDGMCAYYMVFGMTYDEYWNQDVCMAHAFQEAYELKEEIQSEKDNQNAWLQGLYYMKAIEVSTEIITKSFSGKKSNKKIKSEYPKKPFDFKEAVKKQEKIKTMTYEERALRETAQWEQILFSK